ncbi:sterol desaturase family protein [Fluviicola sp.]|uniref:sterol desaturase family protein n=1 Tax=Fluviicola sp. TaxID=1917219 RepID=UPI003D2D9371
MDVIHPYRGIILLAFVVLIFAEIIWSWKMNKKVYEWKETLVNIFILIGFFLSKLLMTGYQLTIMAVVGKFTIGTWEDHWITFLCGFVLVDFFYYWYHRLSHIWEPLWAFHSVHHSTKHINLTAGYRLNWLSGLITPFFFIPLVLIGFSPQIIAISFTMNLVYQFFLHTEAIGKLGKLEGVMDTPSAHRVHHGVNPIYLDKNFGGVFMIWDRLFGTYQPEEERVVYGELNGSESNNPFVLLFYRFALLFRKMKQHVKSWLFTGFLLFGLLVPVFGQAPNSDLMKLSPEKRAKFLTDLMTKELALDSKQQTKILAINEQYALKFETLLNSDEETTTKQKKGLSLQEDREKKFAAILSKKQMKIYREKKAAFEKQLKSLPRKEN